MTRLLPCREEHKNRNNAPMKSETEVRESGQDVAARDVAAAGMTTRQAFLRVFPGVMVAMFLAAADQTILASALPTIASSLGGLADLSWVVVAYLIAATVAAPLYGHLGDRSLLIRREHPENIVPALDDNLEPLRTDRLPGIPWVEPLGVLFSG